MNTKQPTRPSQQLICPTCRLVQPAAKLCRSCHRARPVPPEKLPKPSTDDGESEKAVTVLACWITSLPPIFVASICLVEWYDPSEGVGALLFFASLVLSLGLLWFAIGRKRKASPLTVKRTRLKGGRHRLVGRVRSLPSRVVKAHTTGESCIAASLQLGTLKGLTYLRAARSAEFVVEQPDGSGVVVRGDVWVRQPRAPRSGRQLVPAIVEELNLHPGLAKLPAVVEEHILREGDWVELCGELGFEGVNRCVRAYRDGGLARVLRGRPVLVKVLPDTRLDVKAPQLITAAVVRA